MTLHPFWRSMLRPGATEAILAEIAGELDREASRLNAILGLYSAHRKERQHGCGLPPGKWVATTFNDAVIFACPEHEPRILRGGRLTILKPAPAPMVSDMKVIFERRR